MNLRPAALLLVALAGVLGILGQWAGPDSFPWWRVIAALLILGLLYEWIRVRRYAITAQADATAALRLGRNEQLSLSFSNPLQRAVNLQFVAGLPEPVRGPDGMTQLTLAPQSHEQTFLSVQALELGQHPWRKVPARIGGPLGLAWWPAACPTNAIITVQPDTLGRRGHALGSMSRGSAQQSVTGVGMELHHLRDYLPGDPRHTIDWKASARRAELVTRVFSQDQHLEIMLAIDIGRTCRTEVDGMSQLGHYVNLAARFAEYAVANEDHVGLLTFADKTHHVVAPGRGLATVSRIRQALASLTPQPLESDVLKAALALRRVVRHRCLVIVLSDLYEGTAESRLAQAVSMWVPKHLPVVVGLTGNDIKDRVELRSQQWLDPHRSLAAREYRQHLNASVDSLRRLGAHAIVARPAELDDRVFQHYRLLKAQHRV